MSSLLDLTNCSCMALSKSIESILARVDNRVAYDMIIKVAQGIVDEKELAEWLRILAQQTS